MRVFEGLILVTLFVRFVGCSFPAISRSRWVYCLPGLAMLLIIMHLALEKYRLQMVPAYGLTLVLFLLSIRQLRHRERSQVRNPPNRVLISLSFLLRCLIFAGVASLPIIIPVFYLPDPTGQYPIGVTDLYLVDQTRAEIFSPDPDDLRELMVRVWYPAQIMPGAKLAPLMESPPVQFGHLSLVKTHAYQDAPVSSAQSTFPVLIFSHGHVGFMEQNLTLMEELASRGYIVCSMAHPYHTIVTAFPDGRVIPADPSLANDLLQGRWLPPDIEAEHLRVWTEDTRFLIDELESIQAGEGESLLVGKLDLNRLGVFGQSFGGVTAAKVCMLDNRCKAGVSLDSGLPGDYAASAKDTPLSQPFLFMFNEIAGYSSSSIFRLLKNPVYGIVVQGTTHMDYADLYLYSPVLKFTQMLGPIEGERMVKIINAYTLAFWDETLKGESSLLLDGPSPDYPEVTIQATSR